jgi:hypothetical protein
MSKDISLKSLNPKALINKVAKKYGRHAVFATILFVLLAYIFVVFRISQLSNTEPTPDQKSSNPLAIPQVDQQAIKHIQSLEDNNTQLHSLFQQARNNPFQE